jgi:hypothetical protein
VYGVTGSSQQNDPDGDVVLPLHMGVPVRVPGLQVYHQYFFPELFHQRVGRVHSPNHQEYACVELVIALLPPPLQLPHPQTLVVYQGFFQKLKDKEWVLLFIHKVLQCFCQGWLLYRLQI